MAFRFIHAADIHVDTPFRGVETDVTWVLEYLRAATLQSFDRMIDLAIREEVDFVIIAGDLYDSDQHSLTALLALRRAFDRLGEHHIRVYIAHGNHDPLNGKAYAWPPNVYVFPAGEVTSYVYHQEGRPVAEIQGISYDKPAVTENLVPRFHPGSEAPYHIAVLHANVEGEPGHSNYAPARLSEMQNQGFDYWALGHVHHRKVLSEAPFVVYPGNTQGRHVNETGDKGVYLVDVDDIGQTRLAFHPTAVVAWETLTVSAEGIQDVVDLIPRIQESLDSTAEDLPRVVRLRVQEASEELATELLSRDVVSELCAQYAPDRSDPVWVLVESLKVEALVVREAVSGDFMQAVLDALQEMAHNPQEIREALSLLIQKPQVRRALTADDEWLQAVLEDALTEAHVRLGGSE